MAALNPTPRAVLILASAASLMAAPAGARSLGQRLRELPDEEWVYQGLHAVDAIQTREALDHGCVERNPMLGRHPSTGRLVGVWAATSAAHAGVTMALQDHAPRAVKLWEIASIGVGAGVIAWNLHVRF